MQTVFFELCLTGVIFDRDLKNIPKEEADRKVGCVQELVDQGYEWKLCFALSNVNRINQINIRSFDFEKKDPW